VVQAEEE
jgi:hypothetical protein